MKKTFKWILFSTLILSIGAVIAMLAIYLPQYTKWANYSTKDYECKYNQFISYDDDTLEIVKNEEFGTPLYTLNVRLYNLSNKDQTLTFRFWFTCTDTEGEYFDYVDKEITIPKAKNNFDAGQIDYSCELYYFSHCSNVEYGAEVPFKYLTNISSTDNPEGSHFVDEVLINRDGIRTVNGFEVTSEQDMCETLSTNTEMMKHIDSMWQSAFTGVIIALSCTGGIFVLCLVFTIILLLPNKKKKIEG